MPTTSPLEKFLSRVKVEKYKVGADHGVFKCPAHGDKRASATWRELSDGKLLIHCYAGCSPYEIVTSAGLKLADLFPEKITHHGPRERKPFFATDALRSVAFEAVVVCAAARALADGKPLSSVDHERLLLASERLIGAANAAGL